MISCLNKLSKKGFPFLLLHKSRLVYILLCAKNHRNLLEVRKLLKSLRKEVWYTLCIVMMMEIALYPQTSEAKSLETKAKSAIIVNADMGKELHRKNEAQA